MASICGSPVCAGGKPQLKFTYSGDYVIRDDGVVELLTSGTIVFLEPKVIDVFMVGGGGTGYQKISSANWGGPGGGGGYTRTVRKVSVATNTQIPVTIGAGGATPNRSGNASGFNAFTVDGGKRAEETAGGAGGSGGGGGVISNSDYGAGGSDGNNGESGYPTTTAGGKGQGFSTREFGEATGKLYAGAGGGGRYMSAINPVVSSGGSGGGGTGAFQSAGAIQQAAAAGTANTGGGGGGGAGTGSYQIEGASGGSGIVCFREAQELPELAGTWVLNERLYNPQSDLSLPLIFTAGPVTGTGTEATYNGIVVPASNKGTMQYLTATYNNIYQFTNNVWSMQRQKIIIKADATASDEFRAWLSSNATKQA